MNLKANREHRSSGEDFYLKVADNYVDLLNSLPEFRDLTTAQLKQLLPPKVSPVRSPVGEFFEIRDHAHAEQDRQARAVIIGILAPEALVQEHLGLMFLQRYSRILVGGTMEKAQLQAIEAQEKIRALVVAAGLMPEAEAEEYIIVRVGKLGEGALKDITSLPSHCEGCGCEHDPEDFVPLEIGISRMISDDVRQQIALLMTYTSGPAN